jgi:hypothetical protein
LPWEAARVGRVGGAAMREFPDKFVFWVYSLSFVVRHPFISKEGREY